MTPTQLTYRMAFAGMSGMTAGLARKLLDVVGNEQRFFEMSGAELKQATGGGRSKMYQDGYRRQCLSQAAAEEAFVRDKGITVTYFTDAAYPRRLREVDDAPALIYSLGHCNLDSDHVISVVGTRHATNYGISFCDTLIADLARAVPDLVVVSGLAYGIDIAAHRAALKHGVSTVAVMGRGLNRIYPAAHRAEAVAMVKHDGMLLTEYRSMEEVHKGNFLARNRIIAGLSDCTVVVESGVTGGALVTASLAMNYNRDVLAVPGRCGDEFSAGCNRLIGSNRAGLITGADDLLAAMRWEAAPSEPVQLSLFPDLGDEERQVVAAIRDHGDIHINTLADAVQIPVYRLLGILMDLDCRHVVITLPGCRYMLR